MNVVASKSKRLLFWVTIAAVVVLLVIVGFAAMQKRAVDDAIRSPLDPSVIHGSPIGAAVVSSTTSGSSAASSTVSTYIAFVQSIEQRRTQLRAALPDTVAKLTVAPATPPSSPTAPIPTPGGPPAPAPAAPGGAPTSTGGQEFAAYIQQWQDLIKDFNAQAPPRGAEQLNSDYFRMLQDWVTMLGQIAAQTLPTPESTSKIEADGQSKITPDALTADHSLQALCTSASATKSFAIGPELTPPVAPASATPTGATSN